MRSFRLAVSLVVVLVAGFAFPSWADGPRPLSSRGTVNLAAFARLLSLLRFFHPSDAAAGADWNRMAVAGIDALEGAADAPALAQALEGYFRPIAPTLRVYPHGQRPETPAELRAPAGTDLKIVAWRHFGAGVSGDKEMKVFVSERIDDRLPPRTGSLFQGIKPGRLQGRRVRLRAAVRAEVQPGGFAQLGLRVYRKGAQPSFSDDMADRPIRDASWRTYEIEGEVAPDAEQVVVLLALTGGGKVWFDDVSLTPLDGGPGEPFLNGGFEDGEPGKQPPHWFVPYESVQAGYHPLVRRGEACRKGGCLEIGSDEIATPRIPRPDEVLEADLGGGVTAAVPLSLWADRTGTLPHAGPGSPAPLWAGVDLGGETRSSRLASVALLWGIQQHFHPELDPARPDWVAALSAALEGVARATGREAFLRELRHLLAPLDDAQAIVGHPEDPGPGTLPLAWAWVEERLVVTGAGPEAGGLRVGDVIATIDGRPAAEVLTDVEARISAPRRETRRWLAANALRFGDDPAGVPVQLGVERPGTPPFTVMLTRGTVANVHDTPLPAMAEARPGVFYVDLRQTPRDELLKLLPKLAAARGVVFDLRGQAKPMVSTLLLSHLADRPAQSLSSQVPVVMRPDHRGVLWLTTFLNIKPEEPRLRQVAFVIDGRTRGNSENLLGEVERYGWAEIVGEPSAGSTGTINWTTLPGGYEAVWTGRRVLKHDASPWHGAGVKPTVPVSRTLQGIAAGRDEMVERAVELVAGRP